MDEVLLCRELHVNAARLKHHANLAAHAIRVKRDVMAQDQRAAFARQHQGGEDAEERRLAAAIRAQQAEDLGAVHIKADAVQRHAIAILVVEAFNADHCRVGVCVGVTGVRGFNKRGGQSGPSSWGSEKNQAALFSIINANSSGR